MKKWRKRGFTLVELIVVIAILAVLAAILIPTMSGLINDARETTCLTNRAQAKRMFLMENLLHNVGYTDAAFQTTLTTYYNRTTDLCPSGGTYTWDADKQIVVCSVHGEEEAQQKLEINYNPDPGNDESIRDALIHATADYASIMNTVLSNDPDKAVTTADQNGKNKYMTLIGDDLYFMQKTYLNSYLTEQGLNPLGSTSFSNSAVYCQKVGNEFRVVGAMLKMGDKVAYFIQSSPPKCILTNQKTLEPIYSTNNVTTFKNLYDAINSGTLTATEYNPNTIYNEFFKFN